MKLVKSEILLLIFVVFISSGSTEGETEDAQNEEEKSTESNGANENVNQNLAANENKSMEEAEAEADANGAFPASSQEEDPDEYSYSRLEMRGRMADLRELDPISYFDQKIEYAHRYLIRREACNYTEFAHLMPGFWEDYFRGTANYSEVQIFGNLYWNVSVEFDVDETNATVTGHCQHTERVDNCTVEKHAQLQRERDLCFSGALLECSQDDICVCLASYATVTIRVNHKTGQPDPQGTACFVAEGQPCYIRHYGAADLKLPCVNHLYCDGYSEKCVRELPEY